MDFMQLLLDPVCIVAIALALLSILYVLKGNGYNKLPPGPKPWPIVGNIPLVRGGGAIYEIATNLRQHYGDVVRLKLGPINNVILIMGKDKIHKAAVTMNDKFKYRPTHFFVTNYITKQKGIVFSNGDVHAAIRKFTLGTMRDFGVGKKSLEGRMQEEAGMLTEVLEKLGGKPAYLLDTFKMAVANIIAGIVYGNRFEYDDPVFHGLISKIDTIFKDLSIFLPENFFPALRFLPGSKLSKAFTIFKDLEKYAKSRIEEHRATFDPDNIRDFVDIFLKHEGESSGDDAINEDNLFRVIVDLFIAGTDTTATTVTWAIIHLIKQPDIQDKCRKEIMEVVGTGRYISLEDKKNMPYLQAFIHEVLRYCSIAPQSELHTVMEDTEFEGYTIPKNSIVLFIIYTLLMDKEKWGDPENFRPERFLSETGQLAVDKAHFAPFGLGGRSCVGKHLAKQELFTFLGTLIQRFEFKSPPGSPPPSTRRIQTGITSQPERYDICAVPLNK